MPSLLSTVAWVHQVMDVVENALIDERVEVRSKAGQVLSGLLHCAFVDKERQQSLLVSQTFDTILMHKLSILQKILRQKRPLCNGRALSDLRLLERVLI